MTRAHRASLLHGIYVIVDDSPRTLEIARASVAAGVNVLQYRAKHGVDADRLRTLLRIAREREALVLLDDDWRAAAAFECDGVHLGPGDDGYLDLTPVRAALRDGVVGFSCANAQEMRAAHAAGAEYAGVGSVFATSSKSDAGDPIGLGGLARIAAAAPLPVAAIGGITLENVTDVKATGVAMAAVISAVERARDPAAAAGALVRAWRNA